MVDFVLPIGASHHRFVPILVGSQAGIKEILGRGIIYTRVLNNLSVEFPILPFSLVRQPVHGFSVIYCPVGRLLINVTRVGNGVEHIYLFQHVRHAQVRRELNLSTPSLTFLRGNEHHAVGSTRPIDGRCRGIFKYFERFDVVWVNRGEGVHAHLTAVGGLTRWRASRFKGNTIYNVKRLGACGERVCATHIDADSTARCPVGFVNHHARHLSLQGLVKARSARPQKVVAAYLGHCSREVTFLHRAITHNDDVVEFHGIVLQHHIEGRPVANLQPLALHADTSDV